MISNTSYKMLIIPAPTHGVARNFDWRWGLNRKNFVTLFW